MTPVTTNCDGSGVLSAYLRRTGQDPIAAMNALQDAGSIISNCCVWPDDVPDCDGERAVAWLEARKLSKETP